jgi:hypothetical protein
MPLFKDLYGHPVLRRDGGHVGNLESSSPHTGFMKSGKLRNKKRVALLLLCITVLSVNTISRG